MDRDRYEADVLADLEQQLFPDAVRRFRRRWWTSATAAVAGTVAGLAVVGLAVLPVLFVLMVTGGLVAVSRVAPPAAPARRPVPGRAPHPAQPRGCSTKS